MPKTQNPAGAGFCVLRSGRDQIRLRPSTASARAIGVAFGEVCVAAIVDGDGVSGVEVHRRVEILDGAIVLRAAGIGIAAIVETDGIGLDLDRGIVIGDGAFLLAVVEIGEPAVVQRRGVGRVELDRLVIVGDGLFVIGGGGVGDAAVVVGGRLLRIRLDGFVVIGDGPGPNRPWRAIRRRGWNKRAPGSSRCRCPT